jgi:small subunit ribosomal protein S2
MTDLLPKFTIKQLLEAGVHFGHKSMRRNPKMAKYVHSNRNGISIIDLNKTAKKLQESLVVAHQIAKNNGRILFVGTKKQASEIVAEAAQKCGQYYVNFRWLGGMLTNFKTVSASIKTLRKVEEQLASADVDFNKKEKLVLERKRLKLEQALGGIKNMGGFPDLIIIVDINKEDIAVKEAVCLNVPIMAIVDTNCNPDPVKYVIPGNDDSTKAIRLYCNLIADAIISGVREGMAASGVDVSKFDAKKAENKPKKKEEAAKVEAKEEEKAPAKRKVIIAAEENKKPEAKKKAAPKAKK